MVRREDLNQRADLGPASDGYRGDVKNHAVEVQKRSICEAVEAVVTWNGGRITAPWPTAAKRSSISFRRSDDGISTDALYPGATRGRLPCQLEYRAGSRRRARR